MDLATRSSPRTRPTSAGAWLFLALLVFYLCFFHGLSAIGLVGPDEPRYAAVARNVALTDDWVTPRLHGEPWLEKPILYYWTAGAAYELLGDSETAARLPSALAASVATLALAWLAWGLYGPTSAAVVLIILPTTVGALSFARAATTDMLFAASFTLCLASLTPLLLRSPGRTVRRLLLLAAGASLGLSVLAKGPVGIVLAGGSVAIWALVTGHWRRLGIVLSPLTIGSFAAVTVPWYVLCAIRNPEFVQVFLLQHNVERYLTPVYGHEQPFWFFGPVLLIGLLPWTPLLVSAVWDAARLLASRRWADSPSVFVGCWVVFPVAFFSVSQSKLPGYVLPVVPPLSLLLARSLAVRLDRTDGGGQWLFLGVAACFLSVASALLLVTTSAVTIPGLPPIPLVPVALVVGCAGVVVAGLALIDRRRGAVAATALGVAIAALCLTLDTLPQLDPLISSRTVAREAMALPARQGLAVYRLQRESRHGLEYYLGGALPDWDPAQSGTSHILTTAIEVRQLTTAGLAVEILEDVSPHAVLARVSARRAGQPSGASR